MRKLCLSVWLLWNALAMSGQTELPSAEDLGHEVAFKGLTLSPDGKTLAYAETIKGAHRLYLLDLATNKKIGVDLQGGEKALVHDSDFFWANNKRFVYNTRGVMLAAMDRDGGNGRSGFKGGRLLYASRTEKNPFLLMTGDDENNSYVSYGPLRPMGPTERPFVQRVNPQGIVSLSAEISNPAMDNTGIIREVENPGQVADWVVDAVGQVRAGKEIKNNRYHVLYRSSNQGSWQSLAGMGWEDPEAFPLGFSDDGGILYVGRVSPAGTWALYPYDLRKNALGEPILAHAKFDIVHPTKVGVQGLIYSPKERRLLGVRYETEYPRVFWLDSDMVEVQAALDQALPKKINTIISLSDDLQKMVVLSATAQDPGTYYLFDRTGPKLDRLMTAMPWIKPEQMVDLKPFRFKSRDGVLLNGYLAMPSGRDPKNLPLIVLVDDGNDRVHWSFDPQAQFWASRGYAVMKVGARGQRGYGAAHYQAVDGQVDQLVAADLADGVRWAIGQKLADPARVGIIGLGPWGGYYALQSLITEPELYCCGVNHAGSIDWIELAQETRRRADEVWLDRKRFGVTLGANNEERLRAASPLYNVDKIRAPLLIAHNPEAYFNDGGKKRGRELAAKMKAARKTVELAADSEEEFGYQTMAKYLNDRLAFVQKHMPADQ